jgi:hypothetical protein
MCGDLCAVKMVNELFGTADQGKKKGEVLETQTKGRKKSEIRRTD